MSYRSQNHGSATVAIDPLLDQAKSHAWAIPESRTSDLTALQNAPQEVAYVDLVETQNLEFHQKSEWKEVQRANLDYFLDGNEISKASRLPKDEIQNYQYLTDEFEHAKVFEKYYQAK